MAPPSQPENESDCTTITASIECDCTTITTSNKCLCTTITASNECDCTTITASIECDCTIELQTETNLNINSFPVISGRRQRLTSERRVIDGSLTEANAREKQHKAMPCLSATGERHWLGYRKVGDVHSDVHCVVITLT